MMPSSPVEAIIPEDDIHILKAEFEGVLADANSETLSTELYIRLPARGGPDRVLTPKEP